MKKTHSLIALPVALIEFLQSKSYLPSIKGGLGWGIKTFAGGLILLTIADKASAFPTPELSLPQQGVNLQNYKIGQNNVRDTSTLEKALLGRWVSEPLIPGKPIRLTYYFSAPNIWLTGQEVDGKQVSGGVLTYKIIKVNEKENSIKIEYGLNGAKEPLEATIVFSPERQTLSVLFKANGIYVPSVQPLTYAGSQQQP